MWEGCPCSAEVWRLVAVWWWYRVALLLLLLLSLGWEDMAV